MFDDALVNSVPPHRRDVAMVFQSYALYPQKTVFENIAFGLRLRGVPGARDRPARCATPPSSSRSRTCSSAGRTSCPAASASAWRSAARWCASRRRS